MRRALNKLIISQLAKELIFHKKILTTHTKCKLLKNNFDQIIKKINNQNDLFNQHRVVQSTLKINNKIKAKQIILEAQNIKRKSGLISYKRAFYRKGDNALMVQVFLLI